VTNTLPKVPNLASTSLDMSVKVTNTLLHALVNDPETDTTLTEMERITALVLNNTVTNTNRTDTNSVKAD